MRLSLSILSRRALAADVLAPNVSNAIDSCLRSTAAPSERHPPIQLLVQRQPNN